MRYDCYILRTWRSTGAQGVQWSGRLEHVQSGAVVRFSDVRIMLAYLHQLLQVDAGDGCTAGADQAD